MTTVTFSNVGTFSWVPPLGVTSVNVAVGSTNLTGYAVTPSTKYVVVVGATGALSSFDGNAGSGASGIVVVTYSTVIPSVTILNDTSITGWQVPDDYPTFTSSKVETIGGGAGGATGVTASTGGGGGGGGAYSQELSIALVAATNAQVQIGAGGATDSAGTDTWFNGASLGASSVGAKGGGAPSGATGGTGGAAASGVGTTKRSGGNGGSTSAAAGGGGGGGAGGAAGDGKAGGAASAANTAGAGGGGSNNGSAGSGNSGGSSGAGGNNRNATGGGAAVASGNGNPGTDGGGGSGGGPTTTATGGAGGNGTETDSNNGSGGGGGGAGAASSITNTGGAGGRYGGAGGGGSVFGAAAGGPGGAGFKGAIIITYTVLSTPTEAPYPSGDVRRLIDKKGRTNEFSIQIQRPRIQTLIPPVENVFRRIDGKKRISAEVVPFPPPVQRARPLSFEPSWKTVNRQRPLPKNDDRAIALPILPAPSAGWQQVPPLLTRNKYRGPGLFAMDIAFAPGQLPSFPTGQIAILRWPRSIGR